MEPLNVPDSMEEVLKIAIQLEENGYKYYSESAERIKNSVGKRMLERLANDEKNHIQRFTEMYNALTNNNIENVELKNVPPTTFDEVFDRLKEQLEGAIEDLQETGVDDVEIIQMAIDLENHADLFYAEAAKKARDPKLKQFLQMLSDEEKAHHAVLVKSRQYLEDPSLFFGMGSRF
ncbi:MAG TPA: hypothetical protein ENK44_15265 [Caldithrix abyssi]|uniref:Rubrerythrin diiron-binding domain-containing protein n=1 Tax=Caldithrix abyssi TaxID=187145 RepID=A0A7V4UFE6_CALAY|nr:hypothetical protein [Caldithrix abyssi]